MRVFVLWKVTSISHGDIRRHDGSENFANTDIKNTDARREWRDARASKKITLSLYTL